LGGAKPTEILKITLLCKKVWGESSIRGSDEHLGDKKGHAPAKRTNYAAPDSTIDTRKRAPLET